MITYLGTGFSQDQKSSSKTNKKGKIGITNIRSNRSQNIDLRT